MLNFTLNSKFALFEEFLLDISHFLKQTAGICIHVCMLPAQTLDARHEGQQSQLTLSPISYTDHQTCFLLRKPQPYTQRMNHQQLSRNQIAFLPFLRVHLLDSLLSVCQRSNSSLSAQTSWWNCFIFCKKLHNVSHLKKEATTKHLPFLLPAHRAKKLCYSALLF